MNFIVGILMFLLVLNCILLIFLVLVQLPKKDAGAGLAFGGGAADALFGAGSGNALTKITKWAAGIFLAMALVLGVLQNKLHRGNSTEFEKALQQKQSQTPAMTPTQTPAPSQSGTPPTSGNNLLTPPASDTNVPAK
jgi:protein translocase SecG subunit